MGTITLSAYMAGLPALNIAVIGDSHFNGPTPSAVATGDASGVFGTDGSASPLDRMWSASGDSTAFLANSSLGDVTGSTDPSLGFSTNAGSDVINVPRLLRASYPFRCGVIRVANFGIGGASSYSWAGESASLFTRAVANASAGDTFSVGGVTYTFRAAVAVANDVLIGATANDTNRNLGRAINIDGTAGTDFGTGTVVNPVVYAPVLASSKYLKLVYRGTGTAGNGTVVSSSTAARIAVASTVDLSPVTSASMVGGSATSAIYTNAKTVLAANGGMTPDVVIAALGTNDTLRSGWKASGYQAEMTKLVANIHADWPSAKVILWKPPYRGGSEMSGIVVPAIEALVAANPSFVSAIDMFSFGTGTGDCRVIRSDGIHLTTYGGAGLKSQLTARAIATAMGW